MSAAVISIQEASRQQPAFNRSRDVIAAGGIIAYPTDTFYGLGVDPRNPAAVQRLFGLKSRHPGQPILLLIHDANEVAHWAAGISPAAEKLMQQHWPGPLTLVFKARAEVLGELTAGTATIGLRVPGNDVTRVLLQAVGGAMTGTSANRSGEPAARNAADVAAMFGDTLDLILDGGPSVTKKPSTIVDVSGSRPALIRRGVIEFGVE